MTDNSNAGWGGDIGRIIFTLFDRGAYWLLTLIYEIFFNVSSAQLFTNATIRNFYSRVQLIIGVFMVFKLAVSILEAIINPDKATDKTNGFGNIITRVMFALFMLTILVPINIPNISSDSSEYEIQLNNNGLLFGTLYSLQDRILKGNTLGRLILGTTGSDNESSELTQEEQMSRMKNIFASAILKGFFRINLKPESERVSDDENDSANWMCQDELTDEILDIYDPVDADPQEILDLATLDCSVNFGGSWTGNGRYAFNYKGIFSTVVALIFVYILLNFTVNVAVRAIKIAILRLIAPIPIISYIDPKSGKDGAFSAWTKTLTSTYLDLFIQLAIVYFVIFLIQDILVNGIDISVGTGVLGVISRIFIFLGLFIFAKDAPKFIKQVLGIKEDAGKDWFSGFGKVMGIGTAGLGAVGSALSNMRNTWGKDRDMINSPNKGKRILGHIGRLASTATSGAAGFVGGAYTGAKSAITADKDFSKNARNAIARRNANWAPLGERAGAFAGDMKELLLGKESLDTLKRFKEQAKNFESSLKSEAIKGKYGLGTLDKAEYAYTNNLKGIDESKRLNPGDKFQGNSKELMAIGDAAKAQGKEHFEYRDKEISVNDYARIAGDLEKAEMQTLYGDLRTKGSTGYTSNPELVAMLKVVEDISKSVRGVEVNTDTSKNLHDSIGVVNAKIIEAENSSHYRASQNNKK